MDKTRLLQADYLDIIFDQRNKNYGGYELRRHYRQRVGKSMLVLLCFVGGLTGLSFITANTKAPTNIYSRVDTYKVTKFEQPPITPPRVPEPPSQPLKVHTVMHMPPVITNEPVKPEEQMKPNEELTKAQPGPADSPGDDIGLPSVPGTGTGVVKPAVEVKTPPLEWVAQMPQFTGDMSTYLAGHIHYPAGALSAGIAGTVLVRFVVNEDGSVSDATVIRSVGGGCDEEALRVIMGMPKWKPGRQNGVPVKVYFNLPIKFVLN